MRPNWPRHDAEHNLELPADQIGKRERLAAVRDVDHVDAGHHLEQLAGDMERTPGAARRHVDLARIGLGIGDKLGNRVHRNRWIDFHDKRNGGNARHRRDVADEIEIEFAVERRIDCVCRDGQHQRVAVRRRSYDDFGADITAGARPRAISQARSL